MLMCLAASACSEDLSAASCQPVPLQPLQLISSLFLVYLNKPSNVCKPWFGVEDLAFGCGGLHMAGVCTGHWQS